MPQDWTDWQLSPALAGGLSLLAAGYLVLSARVGRRHPLRPWPRTRTLCFLLGLVVVAVATQSALAVHDDESFAAHMVQHLMLIMVAPPLLIYGRPITLVLHACGNPVHRAVLRAVRSRVVAALTWPPVGATLFAVAVAVTHLTPLVNVMRVHPIAHDAEHVAYLATGYLFFLPVMGSEPIRWRLSPGARYLLLLLTMPVDTVVGLVLMLAPHQLFAAYDDQRLAGAIMWMGGDGIMIAFALGMAVSFVSGWQHTSRRTPWFEQRRRKLLTDQLLRSGIPAPAGVARSVDDDGHLAAYNEYLSQLSPPVGG